jgi:hypothetical protein
MSFKVNPQVTRAAAPGVADDSSKGFVVGSAYLRRATGATQVRDLPSVDTRARENS